MYIRLIYFTNLDKLIEDAAGRKQRHVLASWLMAKRRVAGCLRGNFGTLKPKSKSRRSQKVKLYEKSHKNNNGGHVHRNRGDTSFSGEFCLLLVWRQVFSACVNLGEINIGWRRWRSNNILY